MAQEEGAVAPTPKARKRRPKRGKGVRAIKDDSFSLKTGLLFLGALLLLFGYYYYTSGSKEISLGQTSEPAVGMTILNDKRCLDCDTSRLIAQLRQVFPAMTLKELDVSTSAGSSLYSEARLTALPAVIVDNSVKQTKQYPQLANYFFESGGHILLRIGANWDPYCDPSPLHCAEARCAERLSCMKEVPGKLDLFVMSQCPYGISALDSMKEVLTAFKGEINLSVTYIGTFDASGSPQSLHGPGELDEDVRALCAIKYYPQGYKYLDYVWCRNRDVQSIDWQRCANDSGIDAEKILSCATGDEGGRMIKDSISQGEKMKVYASPTFLINNKRLFNAFTAAGIQKGICGMNPGFSGCTANLTDQAKGLPQGGSCG